MPPAVCPNCGAPVPRRAKCCPGCGADETTGWSEAAHTGGLDLPDEEFNYEEFVREEFGGGGVKPKGIRWYWWLTALLLVIFLLCLFLR
jgi:hypothetical protein